MHSSKLELFTGKDVLDLLSNEAFNSEWDILYNVCSWGTVFQSRSFVSTWYKTYQHIFLPIVIRNLEGGKLTGLLTMAKDQAGQIFGAGSDMSEYQVWLATDANSDHFIKSALLAIQKHFPKSKVQLKYIPDNASMKWVKEDGFFRNRCFLIPFQQPLIKIDSERITKELRKKNRKEKVNRLKRIGELTFERIIDNRLFSSILDELILQFEFRKIAMHNTSLFLNDPLRKSFILSLFDQSLLHVTVLKVNGEIIASNVGTAGKNCVHLQGLNTHAPSFARYSPGILHFLMLGKNLADQGIAIFDLTPGENSYKDALATDYSISHKFYFGSPLNKLANQFKFVFAQQVKKWVSVFDIKSSRLRKWKSRLLFFTDKVRHVRKQHLPFLAKTVMCQVGGTYKTWEYNVNINQPAPFCGLLKLNLNSLHDLLQYEAGGTWLTRWEFLKDAMQRFGVGHIVYSFSEGGRLLACVWLRPYKEVAKKVSATYDDIAADTSWLEGFYCHPQGEDRFPDFLQATSAAAAIDRNQKRLYTIVPAQAKMLVRTLETIGFQKIDCK